MSNELPAPNISYLNGEWTIQGIRFDNCGLRFDRDMKLEAIVGFDDSVDDKDKAAITFVSFEDEPQAADELEAARSKADELWKRQEEGESG